MLGQSIVCSLCYIWMVRFNFCFGCFDGRSFGMYEAQASLNPIMKPNKARGRVMGQDVRGKRFEPEGLGMFHGMKEEVRRCKGGQGTWPYKEELRAARRRGLV